MTYDPLEPTSNALRDPRGRKAHLRDQQLASKVRHCRASGATVTEIGTLVGLDPKTLRKYYAAELQDAAPEGRIKRARAAADQRAVQRARELLHAAQQAKRAARDARDAYHAAAAAARVARGHAASALQLLPAELREAIARTGRQAYYLAHRDSKAAYNKARYAARREELSEQARLRARDRRRSEYWAQSMREVEDVRPGKEDA